MDERFFVTFRSSNGYSLRVLLDEAAPKLTDGFGGWQVVDRPKRTQLTRYNTKPPFRQDIALMFDGWKESVSVEGDVATLIQMSQPASALGQPPTIKLGGTAQRKDLTWVIESIAWDDSKVIWDSVGGQPQRLRQACVVSLMEYVDDTVISTPSNPNVVPGQKKGKHVVTPTGLSMKQIAQIEYHDASKWTVILQANPWLNPDPRNVIPKGTPLFVPDPSTGFSKTFIVP